MRQTGILAMMALSIIGQTASAQNQAPEISNITALADTVFHRLRVFYDLTDAENDTSEVIMAASADGGITFCLRTDSVSGDIGPGIAPGSGKYFEWEYPAYLSETVGSFHIRLNANDRQASDIQQTIDGIDSVRLTDNLSFIEGIRHRVTGAAHLQEVQDSVLDVFNSYGLQAATHEFAFGGGYTGKNLLGTKEGSFNPCRTLVVVGHYDTVDDSPGADDNGASVAGMLEIARVIQNLDLAYSVKFIGFDLEEVGLVGGEEYVATGISPDEHIAGVFNMDMIAYFSNSPNSQTVPEGFDFAFPELYQQLVDNEFRANFIMSTSNEFSDTLMTLFESTAAVHVPELMVGSIQVPGNGELIPDSRRSDHAAFWDAGYMALSISDGADTRNLNYHAPTDVSDSCNMTFATQVTKAVAATILRLAKPMQGDVEEVAVQADPTSGIADGLSDDFYAVAVPGSSAGVFMVHADRPIRNIRVYGISGRQVLEQKGSTVDLTGQSAGMYILSVFSDRGMVNLRVVNSR